MEASVKASAKVFIMRIGRGVLVSAATSGVVQVLRILIPVSLC